MKYVQNATKRLFFGLLCLISVACTINAPPPDVIVVDGTRDISPTMRVTSADLAGLGEATDLFVLTEDMPASYRLDSWHMKLDQVFNVASSLPTAVWMRAENDGGYPIGGAPCDDRYGLTYGQVGGDAPIATNGEHYPNPLGVIFRVFTVDMSSGHPEDFETGEYVDPVGMLAWHVKPGAPLSAVSQMYPGDVTISVVLEAPPEIVDVDPTP